MRVVSLFALALLPVSALAETSASIGGTYGYSLKEENTLGNVGFSLSAGLIKGIGWWSWTGVGMTADDSQWASHVQGIDWSFNRFTTTVQYKVSQDPDVLFKSSEGLDQEVAMKFKVKLW